MFVTHFNKQVKILPGYFRKSQELRLRVRKLRTETKKCYIPFGTSFFQQNTMTKISSLSYNKIGKMTMHFRIE